jgi:PAS domain S-box-containing protein
MKIPLTPQKTTTEKEALELLAEEKKYLNLFHNLLLQTPVAIAIYRGSNYIVELANDKSLAVMGKDKSFIGKPLFLAMPELEYPIKETLDKVMQTGIPFKANEIELSLFRNGKAETGWFNLDYQAIRDDDNTISGIFASVNEITEQVLARKKLENSDTRYNMMLLNSTFSFAVIKGKDLIIDFANNQIKEVWGRGNDIEGKSLFEIMPEISDTPFPALLDEVRVTGIPFHGEDVESPNRLHGNLKGKYFFNFVFQPYLEADDTISGVTIIGNDVTDQVIAKKKIEESEERFRSLADLMPAKISNSDAAGNVTYFSKHWLSFSGYSFEELRDFGYQKMMHPDEQQEFKKRFEHAAITGTDIVMEMRFKNSDGDYIWHLNIVSPIKDKNGVLVNWVGVTTEMQRQKEQREELELAVAERTEELSAANEELIKMNTELEAFTYVSSHDLQEPLRKIRTIAGRILEKENKNLSDSGKNYLHLMQNAAERMQTLILDLLAFSRLSMADRNFETTDLNIIIEEVKNEFKDAIAEKNAVIEVKEICEVKIIPFQFRQLMHNLISNALKFSNPKIPPHIKISSVNITYSKKNEANLSPHKEYCHISISDNGIGFEKEFAEKIFEVFQKLHTKDEYAGTGIGLAIVKKIIENHNGIITVTSELMKGTTFNIYIPV